MSQTDFKARIYETYVSSHPDLVWRQSIRDLLPRAHELRRIIRQHLPPDRSVRILDLGCGHGAFVHFLREAGYQTVVGIDDSAQQVELAAKLRIPGIRRGDLMDELSAMSPQSQDVVIAYDVIEHFEKSEIVQLVQAVYRVLSREGRWIIHTCNGESPFGGASRYGDFTHEVGFTRNSIHQLLSAFGFRSVRCYEDQPAVHGLKSATRWTLWKILRSIMRMYCAVETGDLGKHAIFSRDFLTVAWK